MANMLSEVSIGYPDSPLNCFCDFEYAGPSPGQRAPIRDGEPPVGDGSTPRFALFATDTNALGTIVEEFADILESTLRAPYHPECLWLVRPDGYVALATRPNRWDEIAKYLDLLTKGAEKCMLLIQR